MIRNALSWPASPANTFAAHALMLARDPVALAGTGTPVVLVVNSLAMPVMMSLWRSWTEMLFHLRCCSYSASSHITWLCFVLPCFASFALHCSALQHMINHIALSCTAVRTTAAAVVFVPDSAALTKLVGAPLLMFDYSAVTTIYLLQCHIPSELIAAPRF